MQIVQRVLLSLASVVLCVAAPPAASAQEAEDPTAGPDRPRTEGKRHRYVAIGTNATDLAPLNDRLSAAGYPTFSTETLSVGGGTYRPFGNHLLFGGELNGLFTPQQGVNGRTVFVGGAYGLFTLGYRLEATSQFAAYPRVGVGGGGLVLDIGSAGGSRSGTSSSTRTGARRWEGRAS